jgi:hypothetical protein
MLIFEEQTSPAFGTEFAKKWVAGLNAQWSFQ